MAVEKGMGELMVRWEMERQMLVVGLVVVAEMRGMARMGRRVRVRGSMAGGGWRDRRGLMRIRRSDKKGKVYE